MTRLALSIDLNRCIGCQACTLGCKAGNERPIGGNYIQVREIVRGTFPNLVGSFMHHRCLHCADAACVAVCPTGALSKQNGLTAVEQGMCSACGYCVDACPFGVPKLVDNRVSKCSGCFDRVAEGEKPWCVQTCPSQAIQIGERDKVLADAQAKVGAYKSRYPNAQVYGESLLGGLGTLLILLDKPAVYGLPETVEIPAPLQIWQGVSQNATAGLAGLSAITLGLGYILARRTHKREKAEMLHEMMARAEQAPVKAGAEAGNEEEEHADGR